MEQKRYNAPELLAPVGDMERLISAVRYGADAVYLAGKSCAFQFYKQGA